MTVLIVSAVAATIIGVRASWSSPCGESMVTTVHPLAEEARGRVWRSTAAWFTSTTMVTAALLGGTLAAAGSLIPVEEDVSRVLLAVILLGAGLFDFVGRPPSTTRQLNENWLTGYRGWVIGAGYGAQLGSGFATVVPSWTGYALIPMLLLAGDVAAGAMLGVLFGLGRVLAVAPAALIRDRTSLVRVPDRWVAAEPMVARIFSTVVVGLGLMMLSGTVPLIAVLLVAVATSAVVALRYRPVAS